MGTADRKASIAMLDDAYASMVEMIGLQRSLLAERVPDLDQLHAFSKRIAQTQKHITLLLASMQLLDELHVVQAATLRDGEVHHHDAEG